MLIVLLGLFLGGVSMTLADYLKEPVRDLLRLVRLRRKARQRGWIRYRVHSARTWWSPGTGLIIVCHASDGWRWRPFGADGWHNHFDSEADALEVMMLREPE
jgi:hypothetical protein